jgi:hypothetical protein
LQFLSHINYEIVFIDEYSVATDIIKPYSWQLIGKEEFIFLQGKTKAIKVIFALTKNKLVHMRI